MESYISHGEFIFVNNLLREYNEVKEEIKNLALYKFGWYKQKNVGKKWDRNSSIWIIVVKWKTYRRRIKS